MCTRTAAVSTGPPARVMVFHGAPATSQLAIVAHGGQTNPQLFERALALHAPDLELVVVDVADGRGLPAGMAIEDLDGVVITGSPLNVYDGSPAVTRQIELAHELYERRVPVYGSCWGLQLMAQALGGVVGLNPNGREIGVARNIAPTDPGRDHFLFEGKAAAFDALCTHVDDVQAVPPQAVVLARNGHSAVQALALEQDGRSFLGVQYHPEYTLATIAALLELRMDRLVDEGLAGGRGELTALVADLRTLDADPSRRDVAWRLGLDRHVLDPVTRTAEIGNWLRARVMPRRAAR